MKKSNYLNIDTKIIKVDIDKKKIPRHTSDYIFELSKHYEIQRIVIYRSKSNNFHIKIYLQRPIKLIEAILIQTLLGSDIKRERMNFHRLLHGASDEWNLLFNGFNGR